MADETLRAGKKALSKRIRANPGEAVLEVWCGNGKQKCLISDISTTAVIMENKENNNTL